MSSTIRLSARIERWPVAGAFTIARGAKTYVDVVVAEVAGSGARGRGEATAIYYRDESAESVLAEIEALGAPPVEGWRGWLAEALGPGAARNAVGAALWDWEAKASGVPAAVRAGVAPLRPLATAFTVSLGEPARMEADARAAAGRYGLLKLKLAGDGDLERVAAVRRGAPGARLIVDANESWTGRDVAAEAAALAAFGVELIEQPVTAGHDHLLDGVRSPVPLCADESCHDRADLDRLTGRYQAINVKLDKAGGLDEALALIAEARARGLAVMVGCMLSTSLGLAPAFVAAQGAEWVDLDGALLLARDRDGVMQCEGGVLEPPSRGLWG